MPNIENLENLLRFHHPYNIAKSLGMMRSELADEIVRLGLHKVMRIPDFGDEIQEAVEKSKNKKNG